MEISSGIDRSAPNYEEVYRRHRWAIPPRLNLAHACCDRYAASGRIALTVATGDDIQSFTFAGLADRSSRLATVFRDLRVAGGDRVAVFLPQRVENPLAHLAAWKLGAVSVPLSPLFREDALAYRLGHAEAKVLVTDREHLVHARAAAERLGIHVLLAEEIPHAAPSPCVDTSCDDAAMLLYTSGTSGMPKGALHAHRFVPARLTGFELVHRLEDGPHRDRPFYTPADWAWVGGLVDCVLTPWIFGCPVLGVVRKRFDPRAFVEHVVAHRVRSLFLPPTAIHRLRSELAPSDLAAADVFAIHTAGEPLPPEAYAWATAAFGEGKVFELYGMTEMGATIGNSPYSAVVPGSMGRAYPGHEVALLRDGLPGDAGEVAIRSGDPGMFLGYFRDPDATRARFTDDGAFFLTGDVAERDAAGALHYRGRADDMFNTSGYRVGPTEIEATLAAHPAIEHAGVVASPDAERGAVVKAFVVLRAGFLPDDALAEAIRRHVADHLAVYQVPRIVVFARALPMTTSGKIRRADLRAADADACYGLGGKTHSK